MLLECPLSSNQPLKTKIKHGGSVNDLGLPSKMPVLKVFGEFVKCPSPH